MKIITISDLHLLNTNPVARLDYLPDTQKKKFKYILQYASNTDAIVVITGDIFDRPRSWYLLADTIDILKRFPEVTVYCVFGQHDTYFYNESTKQSTSLGILWKTELIQLLSASPVVFEQESINIYGASISQDVPEVLDTTKKNILSIHAPIAEAALFPSHDYYDAKFFLDKYPDYDIILCGDIHRRFAITADGGKRVILNTGPIVRKEGTVYNMEHVPGFYIIDTKTNDIKFHEIPHKEAEKVLTREHIIDKNERDDSLSEFVSTINESEVKGTDIKKNVQTFIDQNEISDDIKTILATTMNKETRQ